MNKLHQTQSLRQTQTVLQKHWNRKLSRSRDNPYPLAPKDLVLAGFVNHENYAEQNAAFGGFCTSQMEDELRPFYEDAEFFETKPRIEILGSGLARDLEWIENAALKGFKIRICDLSSTACDKVSEKFRPFLDSRLDLIEVVEDEVENIWESEPSVASAKVLAYFASQFIQVQKVPKMRCILGRLGHFLGERQRPGVLARRVYLVHPYPEDNVGPREWAGKTLPSVLWGDTTAYDEKTLTFALEDGAGQEIKIETLGRHAYYHQAYRFLRISVAT